MGLEQSLDRKEKMGFPPFSTWYQRLRNGQASRYRNRTASPCDGCGGWPRWSFPTHSSARWGRRTLRRKGSSRVPCGTRWAWLLLLRWSRQTVSEGRRPHWCRREHRCRFAYLRSKRTGGRCSDGCPWNRANRLRRRSCPWGRILFQGSGKRHPWDSRWRVWPCWHGSRQKPAWWYEPYSIGFWVKLWHSTVLVS